MKRDWDLLRKQLIAIEEDRNVFSEISDKSKWQNEAERENEEIRQLGHLKLLIDDGLVEGIYIKRGMDGHFIFAATNPALTMAGHDLLEALRSPKLWEKIKSLAKNNGIELSVFAVKYLAEKALSSLIN